MHKKRIQSFAMAIGLLCIGAGLLASLAGCSSLKYDRRLVRGAVIPVRSGKDAPTPDLFIVNWAPSENSDMFYATYVVDKDGDRRVLWEKKIAEFDGWYYPRAISDENGVTYAAGSRLLALDLADGSTAWETPLSDLTPYACATCIQKVQDHVIVLTTDYVLQGVDARSGEVAWRVRLNHVTTTQNGFLVADDDVVLVDQVAADSSDWAVHVFDPATGRLKHQIAPTCPDTDRRPRIRPDEMFIELGWARGNRAVFLYHCSSDPYVQSRDLASGDLIWQQSLPPEAARSIDSSMLGQDTLYLDTRDGIFGVGLADGRARNVAQQIDPDFDVTLLAEHEGLIIARAKRTRGSTRYEMWALNDSGERVWRRELATGTLLNFDVGSADSTYRLTPEGITVLQVLDDPARLEAMTLDPQTGQVLVGSTAQVAHASLGGVAWHTHYAYVTVWGDVYVLDLKSGDITPIWP